MVVGLVVSNRRRDDYAHAMTRVQLEAQAAGDTIDVSAFRAAWAQELVSDGTGPVGEPAAALVPKVDGAEAVNYRALDQPPQVVIDYQFSAGGQDGCVRVVRDASGTSTSTGHDICVRSFSADTPN